MITNKTNEQYAQDEIYRDIRGATIDALRLYVERRIPTGGFLQACLENDLKYAVTRADSGNRQAIYAIVIFLCNEIPLACWGSPKKVSDWLDETEGEE